MWECAKFYTIISHSWLMFCPPPSLSLPLSALSLFISRRLVVRGYLSSSKHFLFFRQTGKNIRLRIIGLRVLSLSIAVYAQYNLFRHHHHHSEQFTIWFSVVLLFFDVQVFPVSIVFLLLFSILFLIRLTNSLFFCCCFA